MDWVGIPLETYIFILNFSLPPRSEQVNGAVANEIKHVHSPEVIVVLDSRYDLSYKAMYISTCSIALSMATANINTSTCLSEVLGECRQALFEEDSQSDSTEALPELQSTTIRHLLTNIVIQVNGVTKLLQNLHTAKTCCPDAIPNRVLSGCGEELSPGLSHVSAVFQLSLDTGSLPSDWLKAKISSVYKKGDKHLTENYRPISLTCVSCKILEHMPSPHETPRG